MKFDDLKSLGWNIRKFAKHFTFDWILGRHACLGSEVMTRLDLKLPVQNIQKGRIDLQLDLLKNSNLFPLPEEIKIHLTQADLIQLAIQQANLPSQRLIPPKFILMDSFSELTDQLFIHRQNKWKFCYNWNDLKHNNEFDRIFECFGLIPNQEFTDTYDRFLKMLTTTFPGLPIIYLHFSTALDSREKFIRRESELKKSLNILREKYASLRIIDIAPERITPPTTGDDEYRNFPYHYSSETYDEYTTSTRIALKELNLL